MNTKAEWARYLDEPTEQAAFISGIWAAWKKKLPHTFPKNLLILFSEEDQKAIRLHQLQYSVGFYLMRGVQLGVAFGAVLLSKYFPGA